MDLLPPERRPHRHERPDRIGTDQGGMNEGERSSEAATDQVDLAGFAFAKVDNTLQGDAKIDYAKILQADPIAPRFVLGAPLSSKVDRPNLEPPLGQVIFHGETTRVVTEDEAVHPVTGDQDARVSFFVEPLGWMTLFEFEFPTRPIVHIMKGVLGESHLVSAVLRTVP